MAGASRSLSSSAAAGPIGWSIRVSQRSFRGLSEFFVGDLMGKALWKLVENAQRFPRRGGRVLCVHGPSASTGLVRVRQNGPRGGGLRTGPPASSDCGRPVNDKCSHQHRRSVQAERSSYPGKTVISGTYAIWKLGYSPNWCSRSAICWSRSATCFVRSASCRSRSAISRCSRPFSRCSRSPSASARSARSRHAALVQPR